MFKDFQGGKVAISISSPFFFLFFAIFIKEVIYFLNLINSNLKMQRLIKWYNNFPINL